MTGKLNNSDEQQLPISVQICTLNVETMIKDCLMSVVKNNPAEIIVIDGSSSDKTVTIAEEFGVRIITLGRIGLGNSRQIGIISTTLPYIAIVDADDRLMPDCLKILYNELIDNNFDAIQANNQPFENTTYWQKGWGLNIGLNCNSVGTTNMVGRPALYVTDAIVKVGFDPFFTFFAEDTSLSILFEKQGYRQGIGTGISKRIHATTFQESKMKWISYGRGYALIAYKYSEKKKNMKKHVFWNLPFLRSLIFIKKGFFKYVLFNIFYAHYVVLGYFKENKKINTIVDL